MTKRALLLVNRNSRKGADQADTIVQTLRELQIEVVEDKLCKGETCSDVVLRHKDKVELVIVGGGDGTLNSAADGLVAAKLPVGILPLGTANDAARTLGIPLDLAEACQVIAAGKLKSIDLGQVNGKHFWNVASIGLSVAITRLLTKDVKRSWGVFAYLITACKAIYQMRLFHVEIRHNGEVHRAKTVQVAIGNGRHYGGGMTVAEDATIDDHQLDLYSLELAHWWQLAGLFWRLRTGALGPSKHTRTLRGQEFEIVTRHPRSINTDGELTGQTPAKFRVIPNAVSVFVP